MLPIIFCLHPKGRATRLRPMKLCWLWVPDQRRKVLCLLAILRRPTEFGEYGECDYANEARAESAGSAGINRRRQGRMGHRQGCVGIVDALWGRRRGCMDAAGALWIRRWAGCISLVWGRSAKLIHRLICCPLIDIHEICGPLDLRDSSLLRQMFADIER
jgi:hypothetical protein